MVAEWKRHNRRLSWSLAASSLPARTGPTHMWVSMTETMAKALK